MEHLWTGSCARHGATGKNPCKQGPDASLAAMLKNRPSQRLFSRNPPQSRRARRKTENLVAVSWNPNRNPAQATLATLRYKYPAAWSNCQGGVAVENSRGPEGGKPAKWPHKSQSPGCSAGFFLAWHAWERRRARSLSRWSPCQLPATDNLGLPSPSTFRSLPSRRRSCATANFIPEPVRAQSAAEGAACRPRRDFLRDSCHPFDRYK